MRWLLAALVAAAVVALPASAGGVDPRLFVLHQIDVPPRYEFDEDNSLLISRAVAASLPSAAGEALARSGFVTGFIAPYTNYGPPRWRYVTSAAFVFRQAKGARTFMPLVVKSWFSPALGRPRPVDLGDQALLYSSSSRSTGTAVVWRHGRVLAFVSCAQMTEHRALALAQARKQQRRIASELG